MTVLAEGMQSLVTADPHSMPETNLLVTTEELLIERNRLDAELCRRMQALDIRQVTVSETGRTTRGWLIEEQFLHPTDAGKRLKVARKLPHHPFVAEVFAAGEITLDHVLEILKALDSFPVELREVAEKELTEAARWCDPKLLGQACKELRSRLCVDEDAEAAAQRKYASRWATADSTFDGMLRIEGMFDPESAASLMAAMAPLMVKTGAEDERTTPQRRADAITDLARRALRTGELPDHAGDRPQVIVTMRLTELEDRLLAAQQAGASINGWEVSPETARRLACDADLIPAVLGREGEVLDLGRSTPSWSRAQRRARALEDHGCAFPRCQATADRCELHHDRYWARDHGPTDHSNGIPLCHFHHWLTHHGNWDITRNRATGLIEIRRTDRTVDATTDPLRTVTAHRAGP